MLTTRARVSRTLRDSMIVVSIASLVLGAAPAANAAFVAEDPALADTGGGFSYKRSERCLMQRVNRKRRTRGLSGLSWDKQVSYVARRHARSMAANRSVYHDWTVGDKVTRWRRLGQNSGRGARCKSVFRSFMRSSSHRANVLGTWRHLGVGTYRAGGKLYVQQVFESRRDPGNIYNYP